MKWALYGQYRYHGAAWNAGSGCFLNRPNSPPPGWVTGGGEHSGPLHPLARASAAKAAVAATAASARKIFLMVPLGGFSPRNCGAAPCERTEQGSRQTSPAIRTRSTRRRHLAGRVVPSPAVRPAGPDAV